MRRVIRRAGYYVLFVAGLLVVSTVLYDIGMRVFEPGPYPPEGTDVSLLHSAQVVVETFTATGYGSDSPWRSAQMNVFMLVLDLGLAVCFFLGLPAVFLPLFQDALASTPPTAVDGDLDNHVVVCTYSERAESLVEELASNDVPYVLVEPDADRALELEEIGHRVVHGSPRSVDVLRRANVSRSRAVVADVEDRVDASIVLAGREIDEAVRIVSVVEDPDLAPYHRRAGADAVLTPRTLLGQALARKLTTTVRSNLGDAVEIGEDFDVVEFPVHHGGRFAGRELADSGIAERYGLNVIGAWYRGEFDGAPSPSFVLEPGTVLLVAGNKRSLDRLRRETESTVRRFATGETIVAGYGMVGKTVTSELSDAGFEFTVVDQADEDGVDIVGDATDPDVLREAGIDDANSVVLALPDDTATEFTTLVARDLTPEIEIVARVDATAETRKTYAAGADYVLSLSTVSGRLLAAEVLESERILSADTQVELVRTTAPALAGMALAGAQIREQTGCTVVAVERNGDVHTDLDPSFRFRDGDELVVAGTNAGTNDFLDLFASS